MSTHCDVRWDRLEQTDSLSVLEVTQALQETHYFLRLTENWISHQLRSMDTVLVVTREDPFSYLIELLVA